MPGCVLKRSLYSSTMGARLGLGHSGNSKCGGPPNWGMAHSSMASHAVVSSTAAAAHILVLAWRSDAITARNATWSSPFPSSLGGGFLIFGVILTGLVAKSRTNLCRCKKSTPRIAGVTRLLTTTNSCDTLCCPILTGAMIWSRTCNGSPEAVTSCNCGAGRILVIPWD